jgi:anti-sigma factor ChrR (cupin superfamily)
MSPRSDKHEREHSELVFMYALQTLPSDEVPAAEAHISACAECQQQMETLRPVIDSLVSWPTDVLRPSASLWGRLAQRVASETGGEPLLPAPQRWTERNRVSMLVRLAPGVEYPPHRHAGVEELHLLQGELIINDRKLHPGDYNRAEAGSSDTRVWSETGCTCVLMACTRDVLR